MIDEAFFCSICGKDVQPLHYTARDHCPDCLCSKHVDINPGDRLSDCGGTLRPVAIKPHKKGFQIVYKCDKCGEIKRNISAADDNQQKLLEISALSVFSPPVDGDSKQNKYKSLPRSINRGRSPPYTGITDSRFTTGEHF
jgi:DNA-directed RNA polymerase subunit RPC12/RpoP